MKNIQEVRDSIIASAEKHFSLLGFEKTTLDDITGENGKSKTSIYYHFKNKHEIFKSVMEKEFENVKADLMDVIGHTGAQRIDDMKAYLLTRLDSLQKQGAFRRYASSRFAFGENPVSKVVNDARNNFDIWEKRYFESNIKKGQDEGSIPGTISPEMFSSTLVNILKALEIQFFSSKDKAGMEKTYKGMIDLIVR